MGIGYWVLGYLDIQIIIWWIYCPCLDTIGWYICVDHPGWWYTNMLILVWMVMDHHWWWSSLNILWPMSQNPITNMPHLVSLVSMPHLVSLQWCNFQINLKTFMKKEMSASEIMTVIATKTTMAVRMLVMAMLKKWRHSRIVYSGIPRARTSSWLHTRLDIYRRIWLFWLLVRCWLLVNHQHHHRQIISTLTKRIYKVVKHLNTQLTAEVFT